MTLEDGIKKFEKHSECIQQTLISKEEAEAICEWLRELQEYRDGRRTCEFCKHQDKLEKERPCSLCRHNFMDMFESEEVKADDV